jgi:signal transduction histidine kinase
MEDCAMSTPLRVLILEDHHPDAQLVLHELRHAGFAPLWTQVEDEPGFVAALAEPLDVICADYHLPQFDAVRALALLQERQLDIPFIIVSGSVGEDLAVAAMKHGACDYLLKDRLARLGAAVNQALEKKQLREEKRHTEQALRNYLAMLAHELRNPLAPLLTSLQAARQASIDPPIRQQALDTMGRSVRHLARLVDDLVEATRISQGQIRLKLDRIDFARLTRTAAEDRRLLFEQAELSLTVQTPRLPVWVSGDETRLAQCLHNLLDNAVRFTDKGGSVRLTIVEEAQHVAAVVQDTGIGIARDLLRSLFRPFSQAEQGLDRSRGGLGLGLSVVKTLVEAHQGTVAASSEGPGRGSTFTLRLPREPEPAALARPPEPKKLAADKRKILVIEDNREAADSLRLLLQLLGHDVAVAYTGTDGVATAVAWKPDTVLSDIGLPELDGYGVAAALRKDRATARARLIAVTGYGSDDDRCHAKEAGFDHLMRKPVDPEELEQLLELYELAPAGSALH